MLEAAKEEIPALPLLWGESVLSLAADPALLENRIGPKSQLAENSRQGFELRSSTLRWGGSEVKSRTALGMRGTLYDECIRSRCSGKERDSEDNLDNFGARYYGSSLGRFTSVDPVIITPMRELDPQQLNRFAYVRNNPLQLVDPTGEILQLSGDLVADKATICDIVGSDNCNRITIDEKNNTVSFDTRGLDLTKNEGATLINQLVTSSDTFGFSLSDTANTAGGEVKMTKEAISNLDDRADDRFGAGKRQTDLPPNGVADQVTINPANAHFHDSRKASVSISSLAFHELAEAYAKIEGAKAYGDFQNITSDGAILVVEPKIQQGAHNEAVERERKLIDQRPNLKESGRAGDRLIRDSK
jgi:RHS repeat-associated protein